MSDLCESVTERIALGEPLGELADHAARCAQCTRMTAMPGRIAAATERPDPGLGFAARMTIGAQHQLVRRRRNRIAGTAAVSAAAAALAVFVLTRSPASEAPVEPTRAALEPIKQPPVAVEDKAQPASDPELVELVNLADTRRALRESAPWGRIRKPLRPYIQLVKGVAP